MAGVLLVGAVKSIIVRIDDATTIHVAVPPVLSFEAAKAYALAYITYELERYALDEALGAQGFIKTEDAAKALAADNDRRGLE